VNGLQVVIHGIIARVHRESLGLLERGPLFLVQRLIYFLRAYKTNLMLSCVLCLYAENTALVPV
jgi:hypothetical protein